MAKVKLDSGALQAYLAEGHSQADAARHFNVSQAAISLRVKQQCLTTTKVVALERAHEVISHRLTAAERLQRVQQVVLSQLDWAEAQAQRPGANRDALADTLVQLGEASYPAQLGREPGLNAPIWDWLS